MLRISWKSGVDSANSWFNLVRRKHIVRITPHCFDNFGIILCDSALWSKSILSINLFFIKTLEEVECQNFSVGQTLKTTVQIAGVAKIFQSNVSPWAITCHFHLNWLVQFLKFNILAISNMEAFVFVFALLVAVCNFLTVAGKFKFGNIIASLAFLLCLCVHKPALCFLFYFNYKEISLFHLQILYFYFVCQPISEASDTVLIVSPISSSPQVLEQRIKSFLPVNFPKSPLCLVRKFILREDFINKILGDCILLFLN